MRQTITQQLASQRKRTEKWRAVRTERRTPEARQVDKALLIALLLTGRHKDGISLDRSQINQAYKLTIRLLVRERCDKQEAYKAIIRRISQLSRKQHLVDLEAWEAMMAEAPPAVSE